MGYITSCDTQNNTGGYLGFSILGNLSPVSVSIMIFVFMINYQMNTFYNVQNIVSIVKLRLGALIPRSVGPSVGPPKITKKLQYSTKH